MWDKVYRDVAGGQKMDINGSVLVHSVSVFGSSPFLYQALITKNLHLIFNKIFKMVNICINP